MKKNFLLAMVMMLMTTVNALAQKEYNMVITLNNGTTVTLGHNDIKEITFNDGEVSISGNMVNTIDSLAGVTTALDNKIMAVATMTDDNFEKMGTAADEKINTLATAIAGDLHDLMASYDESFDDVDYNFQIIIGKIQMIMETMQELHPELANSPEIKNAKAALAATRKAAIKKDNNK